MKNKVFLTEEISIKGEQVLEECCEVVKGTKTDKQSIIEQAQGCRGMLIRSTVHIDDEVMAGIDTLQIIARHGAGVDNIDVSAATKRNILIVNTPVANTNAVAEHALALMLSLAKRVTELDNLVKTGDFSKRNAYKTKELKGKTLGLIGLGKISRAFARTVSCFDMKVIGFDPIVTQAQLDDVAITKMEFEDVLKQSDYLSVHIPLLASTRSLFDKTVFSKMKHGSYFLNTARGELVIEKDLVEALSSGHLAGAALDVFESEPPDINSELFKMPNVIVTPHSAALTNDALDNMATHSAQGIVDYFNGITPQYMINPEILK